MTLVPLAAIPFEDFIDGYFPLNVSLGALLHRHRFPSAWIAIRVAPMMHIADLPPDAPVPLHLDPDVGGELTWFAGTIVSEGQDPVLSGRAEWRWNDPALQGLTRLPADLRLAEPAFVRGIGFVAGNVQTRSLGKIKEGPADSDVALIPKHTAAASHNLTGTCLRCPLSNSDGVTRQTPTDQCLSSATNTPLEAHEHDSLLISDSNNALTRRVIADSLPP